MSKKTSNYYLKSTKQFFSWMKSDSRIGENPLETLVGVNAQTDIRRVRRALNPEELNKLIESAFQGENSHGLSCRERGMLYILAAFTGLRANELASLKWRSFDFDTHSPCLRVEATYSKHRREDLLPIPAEIAALFKQWKEERNEDADTKVFCAGKYMNAKRRPREG